MCFFVLLQAPPPEPKRVRKEAKGAEAKAISAAKSDEQRNPNLPTSVPLPMSAAEVTNNEHMAAFFATAAKSSAPTEPQGV